MLAEYACRINDLDLCCHVTSLTCPIDRTLLLQNNRLIGPIPGVVGDLVNLLCVPVKSVSIAPPLYLGGIRVAWCAACNTTRCQ
jgi:hypothetical protein